MTFDRSDWDILTMTDFDHKRVDNDYIRLKETMEEEGMLKTSIWLCFLWYYYFNRLSVPL